MAKDWTLYALHTLDCIDKIKLISARGDLAKDFVLYDATLRNLQTLSESTAHLPDNLKDQYSNIDWKSINGFRNILVHDYLGEIDPAAIQKIITNYLPELENVIKSMLKE